MDRAMVKCSKLITRHSIKAKPKKDNKQLSKRKRDFYNKKEYNRWVDDAYILIGKARVFKGELSQALQTFNYVKNQFSDNNEIMEAELWIAKIYMEQKEMKNAFDILDNLERSKKFPKKLSIELFTTLADYYLRENKYNMAISYLEKAIKLEKSKNNKIRFNYLIAQLYQKENKFEQSLEAFSKVIKMSPKYDFVFNAQVSMASATNKNADNSQIRQQLEKMLKDEKNNDYKDQIYFGLAEIASRENQKNEALALYLKSINASISNNNQKGISYLKAADIYFEKNKYTLAKAYYDSTLKTIQNDYPNYEQLFKQTKNINKLVTQLYIVEREDSLQKIAAMSESQRNKLIDGFIQKIVEEEQRIKDLEQQRRMDINTYNQNRYTSNLDQSTAGKWYFYNPATISHGQNEFKLKWGDRRLEDNWRRKNKQQNIGAEMEESLTAKEEDKKKNLDKKTREYYLEDLPLTDSLLMESKRKVEMAAFKVGEVYKNDFLNFKEAINAFENFVERFPYSKQTIMAYYYLFELSNKTKDIQKADLYKNLIINKYPESNYAKYLIDPGYFKQLEAESKKVELFYQQTYNQYKTGNFAQVVDFYQYAIDNYKESDLIPKFHLLKAMAIGELKNAEAFKTELTEISNKYKNTNEAKDAQELLDLIKAREIKLAMASETELKTSKDSTSKEEVKQTKSTNYRLEKNKTHYFVFIFNQKDVNVNQLNFKFVAFNVDFYLNDNLTIEREKFDEDYMFFQVISFKNAKEAEIYQKKLSENESRFKEEIPSNDYRHFIISESNLNLLKAEKDLAGYLNFLKTNYSENEAHE